MGVAVDAAKGRLIPIGRGKDDAALHALHQAALAGNGELGRVVVFNMRDDVEGLSFHGSLRS